MTVAQVLGIGRTFPGVEESTSFGAPALKACPERMPSNARRVERVKGKLMACVPTNKAAEPNSFMFRMDRRDRPALLAEAPDLYYCPGHYVDYDAVLVRLDRLTPEVARDLLAMAHRFVTARNPPRTRSRNSSR